MIAFIDSELIRDIRPLEDHLDSWLRNCADAYGSHIVSLTYQFCDEEEMLAYNQEHLDHHDLTDILTFPGLQNGVRGRIYGDVLINVDRLRDNAQTYQTSEDQELLRLMSHGLLHLIGYTDATPDAKAIMRAEEDRCIALSLEH